MLKFILTDTEFNQAKNGGLTAKLKFTFENKFGSSEWYTYMVDVTLKGIF